MGMTYYLLYQRGALQTSRERKNYVFLESKYFRGTFLANVRSNLFCKTKTARRTARQLLFAITHIIQISILFPSCFDNKILTKIVLKKYSVSTILF